LARRPVRASLIDSPVERRYVVNGVTLAPLVPG
jgi:hypothetical protein